MPAVLTITCHRAYNYGAVLQAYALQTAVEEAGADCGVIDYQPPYLRRKKGSLPVRIAWQFYRLPDFIAGKRAFGAFVRQYLHCTRPYRSFADLCEDPPKADVYLAGSDQIWNYKIENGWDDSYFLAFAPAGSKKCSYAASIAQTELPPDVAARYRTLLRDFDHLTVREQTAQSLLEGIGCEGVRTVLDPVYLLTAAQWHALAAPFACDEKYILLYAFNCHEEILQYARRLAREKGCRLYVINTRVRDYTLQGDRHFWNISPTLFLSLVEGAEFVVTNSFHGFSFSLLFEKQVAVFSKVSGGNSRLTDLMQAFGVADCKTGAQIDYYHTSPAIARQREESLRLLRAMLS